MTSIKGFRQLPLLAAIGLAFAGAQAQAAGLITNGTVALGVKDSGALNVSHGGATIYGPTYDLSETGTVGGTGVRGLFPADRDGDGLNGGYEATFPGCTCEGWGVAVASTGLKGYDGNGFSGLTLAPSVFGTDGAGNGIATTKATIGGQLEVTHSYKPSASAFLYEVTVTIKNISGADLGTGATDLRYTRLMDWDTEPTPFSEFVTIQGHPAANLLYTNDDGFEPADPLYGFRSSIAACAPASTSFVDCGPTDHGARFDFGFNALLGADDPSTPDVDESMRTLTIFYGAAPTESAALGALGAVGAEVYSLGQCNPSNPACSITAGTPITYIFGFKGVGGRPVDPDPDPVPVPGTLALLGMGLAGMGLTRRRKVA